MLSRKDINTASSTNRFNARLALSVGLTAAFAWWVVNSIWYTWGPDEAVLICMARDFLRQDRLPSHGVLSSVAAYNPPGLIWLTLPGLLFFDDPRWIALIAAGPLNLVGALAFYSLASRVLGRNWAVAATSMYCFLPRPVYFASSLWAQSYLAAFYSVTLFALSKWVIDRKPWGAGLAFAAIVYATTIHFSAIVLVGVWIAVFVFWQPPFSARWMSAAIVFCLILLAPYLHFESGRKFQDIRAFLKRESLETETLGKKLSVAQEAARYGRSRLYVLARPWALMALRTPHGIVQTLSTNFYLDSEFRNPGTRRLANASLFCLGIAFTWGMLARIGFLLKRRCGASFRKDEPGEQVLNLSVLATLIVAFSIAFLGMERRTSFAWPLLPLQCLIACWGGYDILRRLRWGRRFRQGVAIAAFSIVILCSMASSAARLIGLTSGEIGQSGLVQKRVVGFIADDMSSRGSTDLSVSYDFLIERPMWIFVPRYHRIDPLYRMGLEFEYFFENRSGWTIHPIPANGIVENARYTIVLDDGEKRYDSTRFEKHSFGPYTVLVRK